MGNLPINGNLPIEAKGISNIRWNNSQYRLQDLPVVGIATVFILASIVCTYNHITVNNGQKSSDAFKKNHCILSIDIVQSCQWGPKSHFQI